MKPKLVTLGDPLTYMAADLVTLRAFRELPALVGEAEEGLCEGIVTGSSSPAPERRKASSSEENTLSADQGVA